MKYILLLLLVIAGNGISEAVTTPVQQVKVFVIHTERRPFVRRPMRRYLLRRHFIRQMHQGRPGHPVRPGHYGPRHR